MLGYIPADAILDEICGEHKISPGKARRLPCSIGVWINKSTLNPLLSPVCEKFGATLVSVQDRASDDALNALYDYFTDPIIILCLCDLNPSKAFFAGDLAARIAGAKPSGCHADLRLKMYRPLARADSDSEDSHG